MIKAIALDLDGTLTNGKKEITPRTRQAIDACIDMGVHIILASGRPTPGIWPVARTLGLDKRGGYMLSYNGAQIVDCRTGQVLAQEVLPREWIGPIAKQASRAGGVPVTYGEDAIYTLDAQDQYVQLESRICQLPLRQVEDLGQAVNWDVPKVLVARAPQHMAHVEEQMQQAFAGKLSIYKSSAFFLEVMPLGVEKAQSLRALLTILGLTPEQLMACGDSWNDLSMIELAGLGVAMGNAVPQVKQVANFVTQDNEHDGVAFAIERFIVDNVGNH